MVIHKIRTVDQQEYSTCWSWTKTSMTLFFTKGGRKLIFPQYRQQYSVLQCNINIYGRTMRILLVECHELVKIMHGTT